MSQTNRENIVEQERAMIALEAGNKMLRDKIQWWSKMTSQQMQLQLGEMTVGEVRCVRAAMNNILASQPPA